MTATEQPSVTITGPAEMVGAVPYLLGFHPEQSLMIVGVDGTKLLVTARIDLADVTETDVVAHTLQAIKRGNATAVTGVAYTDDHRLGERAGLRLRHESAAAGITVVATLLVSDGRWWCIGCEATDRCPTEGAVMPIEPTPLDAAAVYAGLTVAPSRDALVAMFTPMHDQPGMEAELLHHHEAQRSAALRSRLATYDRSVIRALFAAHRAAQAGRMPTDLESARYAVALQSYTVRDALWLAVDDGRLVGIELWVNLARRLPDPYGAAPLFLAGWRAFRDGNGALAGIAADLAQRADPAYSAADLLLAALARGVDPRSLPTLRGQRPPKGSDAPTRTA